MEIVKPPLTPAQQVMDMQQRCSFEFARIQTACKALGFAVPEMTDKPYIGLGQIANTLESCAFFVHAMESIKRLALPGDDPATRIVIDALKKVYGK